MEVPIAAFPFPVVVCQTVTIQTPVSGSVMVNQTQQTTQQNVFVVVAA